MKMPRWLVISLLSISVLSVLGTAGWWWVAWPEIRAQTFVALVREGNWSAASAILQPSGRWMIERGDEITGHSSRCPKYFDFPKRNLADVVRGHYRFCAGLWNEWEFVVETGTISVRLNSLVKGLGKPMVDEAIDVPQMLFPGAYFHWLETSTNGPLPSLFDPATLLLRSPGPGSELNLEP